MGKKKPKLSKKKVYDKFWHKIDGRRQFAFKDRNGKYVTLSLYRKVAKGISLVKYVKVKNDVSVYNGDLNYWSRRAITSDLKTKLKNKLLKRQNYKCSICGKTFLSFDIIETDHKTLMAKGGSHKITNLQLLHAVCHDKKI